MFLLFWWAVIILSGIYGRSLQTFNLENTDIVFGILFLCIELMIFFDLPGSKFLKNSDQFALKSTALAEVVSKNEEKIKKIRLLIFIPTFIVAIVLSGIFRRSQMFWYYFYFWFCANLDIALALASPEEKKLYWQKFRTENFKGVLVALATFVGILAVWFYFFK